MFWKSATLFLSGLWLASTVQAQPDTAWTKRFGDEGDQICHALIQTADGGFAMTGFTQVEQRVGRGACFLIKTDPSGESDWSQIYDEDSTACPNSMILTDDGGFALSGNYTVAGGGGFDFGLTRTDSLGQRTWTHHYGGPQTDWCWSVIETSDGGFVLAGYTWSFGVGERDFWLVKTDADGVVLWSRTFGGAGADICYSVIQTSDGGLAFAGTTESFGSGEQDFWLIRTNQNGDSLWSRTYGGINADQCYTLIQTSDAGFALAGYTWLTNNEGRGNFYIVRTDENGDILWTKNFGGASSEVCYSILQTADGGFALAGDSESFGNGYLDFWMVRIDSDGNSLWSANFGNPPKDECVSVVMTADGSFVLGGTSYSFAGSGDFYLVKTTPDPVSVSNNGFVPNPTFLSLLSTYPNPFNSSISVGFRTASPGMYALDVIDPQGRSLGVISQGYKLAGERRLVWNSDGLPGGNYWLRLTDSQGGQDIKSIVLVR